MFKWFMGNWFSYVEADDSDDSKGKNSDYYFTTSRFFTVHTPADGCAQGAAGKEEYVL